MARKEELLHILKIGHETSMRGEGISLVEALNRNRYKEVRASFNSTDLLPIIQEYPELVFQWVMYSEDKRTSGGYYLLESGVIGQVDPVFSAERFDSLQKAVAEYVIRELDFWAKL